MIALEPVFICAVPRSGTTLLADLLGGSPDAISLQETGFKFRSHTGLTERSDYEHWKKTGEPTLVNSDVGDHVEFPLSNKDFYIAAIDRYISINAPDKKARVAIDQSPDNVLSAHLLAEAFPTSRFIHLVRDGRAVFNSVKNLAWGPRTPFAAATWWASQIAPGLALEQSLGPDRVLRVRYEDLVQDPHATLQRLCEFIGIRFVPEMVAGGGVKLSPYASDVHPNIGQSPLVSRMNAWETQLLAEEAEGFTLTTTALLHWLGYSVPANTWHKTLPKGRRARWIAEELLFRHFVKPVRQKLRRRGSRATFR